MILAFLQQAASGEAAGGEASLVLPNLDTARFFGDRHGANLRRVYSIDTFVSSDTPKESPHFAFAPLGSGAVLRAVEPLRAFDSHVLGPRGRRRQADVRERAAADDHARRVEIDRRQLGLTLFGDGEPQHYCARAFASSSRYW